LKSAPEGTGDKSVASFALGESLIVRAALHSIPIARSR
jgi:hypothetical protein